MADFELIRGQDNGNPPDTLRQAYPKINRNFQKAKTRIDNIVAQSGNDNTEIVDARGGYPVLSARLNEMISKSKLPWYDVTDYGAKGGGGVTDDTAAIQSACDAAFAAGGGNVFFPPGRYKTTSSLIIKPNVILSGTGRHASTIVGSTASMVIISLVQSTLTRTYNEIYSLGFEGGAANVTAIKSVLSSAMRFEDLYFGGCLYNFDLDRGSNFQIEGILVEGLPTRRAGKSIFHDTTSTDYLYDLQITDYQIRNIGNSVESPSMTLSRCIGSFISSYHVNDLSTADGILFSGDCQGCKVENSIIVRPKTYGIKFISESGSWPIAMTIDDVDIDQAQLNGIQIDAGFWYTITGGNITSSGQHGIVLNSNNVTIEGTKIVTAIAQGIQVNANVTNFVITGNHIEGTAVAVLVSAGTSDNYIITNNNLAVINTTKIADSGTGNNKLINNNLGINDKYPREYSVSLVKTLTGGATSEKVSIPIPAGLFPDKPTVGFMFESDPIQRYIIGYYSFDTSTPTNAVFTCVRNDGTTIGGGGLRFSVLLKS